MRLTLMGYNMPPPSLPLLFVPMRLDYYALVNVAEGQEVVHNALSDRGSPSLLYEYGTKIKTDTKLVNLGQLFVVFRAGRVFILSHGGYLEYLQYVAGDIRGSKKTPCYFALDTDDLLALDKICFREAIVPLEKPRQDVEWLEGDTSLILGRCPRVGRVARVGDYMLPLGSSKYISVSNGIFRLDKHTVKVDGGKAVFWKKERK